MIPENSVWGGVLPQDSTLIREAYRYAHNFLRDYAKIATRNLRLSKHCSPPGCVPVALMNFLEDNGIIIVGESIELDDYASWIIPLGPVEGNTAPQQTLIRIATDPDQIAEWASITGLPEPVQLTRIMIHEFAHKLFHHRLVEGEHHFAGRAATSLSSAQEEEEAWVFAFFFLTFVIAEYSRVSRDRVGVDNTPARFI